MQEVELEDEATRERQAIASRGRAPRRRMDQQSNRAHVNSGQVNTWTWTASSTSSTSSGISFSGNTACGIAVGITVPLKCFNLFIPPSFYEELLVQTNLYAYQQHLANNDTSRWNPITLNKLKAFIGNIFAMGIISLPAINDYWSTDPIMSHSWFRAVISRNHYLQILRYIHVVDNTSAPTRTDPNYDRLWKVRPLIDLLQHTCAEMYNPGQQLSIDESMIGTKCRLSFIQYLPAKPTKWGIKVWVCSDAATGNILSFSIYTGKDPNVSISPNGLAYDVVMRLLENKFNKGYSVFVDNFYSSPNLFLDLFNKGVSGREQTGRIFLQN